MIVDCFTFYNELKMLKFRLEYLWDTADYFVIVEATTTHVGNPKPLFFKDNRTMFEKYISKIIHVVVDDMPQSRDAWVPERFQRNCIDRGIVSLDLLDSDLIMISDCDEIPNKYTIRSLCGNVQDGVYALSQRMYYYNLSGLVSVPWDYARVLNYKSYKEIGRSPQLVREAKPLHHLANGGWHFSYFGSPEFISNKIKNFAHQEFNTTEYTDTSNIKSRIEKNEDIYGRYWVRMGNIDIDPSTLPENYEMLIDM